MPKRSQQVHILPVAVPLQEEEIAALDAMKNRDIKRGYWVAEAIREKLERDGLLVKEPQA
jgi:hypothetical protein